MDHVRGTNDARPEHIDQVVQAAQAAAQRQQDQVVVIGIDGPACSGKTSLAARLAGELGDAWVVHMDDLYPGWDGLAAAVPRLTDDIIIPLRAGDPGFYERYDWAAGEFADEVQVPVTKFLIVEGCGSTVGPAGQLVDVSLWLDADEAVRRARGERRDEGGFADHWDDWAQQEQEVFGADETREHADLVIDTTA